MQRCKAQAELLQGGSSEWRAGTHDLYAIPNIVEATAVQRKASTLVVVEGAMNSECTLDFIITDQHQHQHQHQVLFSVPSAPLWC